MANKILTVDDSKTIRMIVARAFKPFDCEALEAANGVEGLALASREKPDLIILDYTMPIMDGFEMLTKLKTDPELKLIPVVMLTAESGRDSVLKIARMGVRDYLIKPFKEDLIVERVSRIIDLKPRGEAAARARRFDDPLSVLVVDDKPAILEQVKAGMQDTPWTVQGKPQAGQAVDFCSQSPADVILVSLTLPDNTAYTLFQMLRASNKTKTVPIFALSVKTAAEEQLRAQQLGFTGIVTKPIDFDELKLKITRALNLDTSFKYFEQRQGALLLKMPAPLTAISVNEMTHHLRSKLTEAVDSGLDKVVLDFSALQSADLALIKLGLSAIQLCHSLSLRYALIGGPSISRDCKNYEETKDWRFTVSFEDALSLLNGKALAAA